MMRLRKSLKSSLNVEGGQESELKGDRETNEAKEKQLYNLKEDDTGLIKAGKRIMANGAMLLGNGNRLLTAKLIEEHLGGKDAFLRIFERFYERLFDDPLMNVLFNESRDVKPAAEHGKILGCFILTLIGDRDYFSLDGKHGLSEAHTRAKNCPLRKEEHRGRGFTKKQAWTWLGHLDASMYDLNVPKPFRENMLLILGGRISRYGPFIED